jgi:alkylation response protein AidB-like acyl-CoA dehydrogenase
MDTHSETESRAVAEQARETSWRGRGFLREMFLGSFRYDWLEAMKAPSISPDAEVFHRALAHLFEHDVDSAQIDARGEYPVQVLDSLKRLGAFGMKIPKEYGGLGFNQLEYARALEICGRYDGSITALLSAHQSIGVPQPLELFGTEEQKRRYLPRCAAGAVSAFALTEPDVGSDPAHMATTARRTVEGDYLLNGEKLWCTNGTIAELIVVMARNVQGKGISAFVVETNWAGVQRGPRCHFMGLRAIENGVIRFDNVLVPKENLVGEEGQGLKIALTTLNTGRLGLPSACVGLTKRCTSIVRSWATERVQWGKPIGEHEAIAQRIADMHTTTYALEAMNELACELAMRDDYDIRIEAAVAKEWATVWAWHVVDETMQIRGGRGYETEASLATRGEPAIGVERMLRDCRINLIFEGSSEIMRLFIAREALDPHLRAAGAALNSQFPVGRRLAGAFKAAGFYLGWYPKQWWFPADWQSVPASACESAVLTSHLRFAAGASRKLARELFHAMLRHGPALEKRQLLLGRFVEIGAELFAIAATCLRADSLCRTKSCGMEPGDVLELADCFCRMSRLKIEAGFRGIAENADDAGYRVAQQVLAGRFASLERGTSSGREPV